MKTIYDCENFKIDCDGETHFIIAKPNETIVDTTPCICEKDSQG